MGRSARADLTVRQVETTTKIGYTADGKQPGLNLQVTASASGYARSWVFRYTSPTTGKRRELGLGPLSSVGLAKAREQLEKQETRLLKASTRRTPVMLRRPRIWRGVSA